MAFPGWKKWLSLDERNAQIRRHRSKQREDIERAYEWIISNVRPNFKMTLDEMCQNFAGSALPYIQRVMKRAIKIHREEGEILLYKKGEYFQLTDEHNRRFAKNKRDAILAGGTGSIISSLVIDSKAQGLGSPALIQKATIVKRSNRLLDKDLAKRLRGIRVV